MAHRDPSPRKTVPLASGDDRPQTMRSKSGPSITKRVFFCGVVVENSGYGRELPPDVQELVASLGEPLDLGPDASILSSSTDPFTNSSQSGEGPHGRKRAMTDSTALQDVINEFVSTEQSYVKRLRILKTDYADPLRTFSRSKNTAILPPYEAKTLFGNIDQLLPVNEAFMYDLERMMQPDGPQTVGGIGDVALKHFKEYRGFENYKQYYSKREEAQGIFEKEMRKASSFAAFIDRIKYSSSDTKNRVGLRELLMDPVQRIPRYTLLFRAMIKFMAPHDPQRAKLLEADDIASKIAQAEADEQTKRAAIMYCLGATVEDFPPALISNSRRFIDCIDVEDVFSDTMPSASAAGQVLGNLHCTLFLFDDKLVIVKRPGNGEKGGRALSGLNDLDKLAKSGGLPMGLKKSGMVCKGVVDVTDVVVTDVGGADFHIYLETPPQDQGERWSGRPFRSLAVVNPPAPLNLDPTRTEADKRRFLENLWSVQARFRTRLNQSVLLCTDDREVETRGARVTIARTYFNVYQRTAFMKETKKTKVVLHIDHEGSADPIPLISRTAPFVVVRVQPMAGELSRYTVTSSDPNDEGEEDIVQTGRVPDRIVQTIHQFGLFKFRTGNNSMPSTPTASVRSRAAIFGLDAISRNLFNALPGSSRGDIFGGSINSHRRSKTTAGSRSSVYTQSTSTGDGSMSRFSRSRSNSTVTSATTMSFMEDEQSMSIHSGSGNSRTRSRSLSKAKKLIKRGKSPGGSGSEPEPSPHRLHSRLSQSTSSLPNPRSRSPSVERGTADASDWDEEETINLRASSALDESERDLVARLELARRNSQNQHESKYSRAPAEPPLEETIYEEEPQPARPASRASKMSRDLPELPDGQSPRSPSPLPPAPLSIDTNFSREPEEDEDVEMDDIVPDMPETPRRGRDGGSPLPRSKRQPFELVSNTDTTPKATGGTGEETPIVEPLSIKKKTSVRTNGSPPTRRSYQVQRSSPLLKPTNRLTSSERRNGAQTRQSRIPVPSSIASSSHASSSKEIEEAEQLLTTYESTREDLDSAYRAVKRIKLEVEQARSSVPTPVSPGGDFSRPSSPVKGLRTAGFNSPTVQTREAQARFEEMQRLIGKRFGDAPRVHPFNMVPSASLSRLSDDGGSPSSSRDTALSTIEELATQAEGEISKAAKGHAELLSGMRSLTSHVKEKSADLANTKLELQGARRQCEVVKSLLADCTAEKEIMYEAFNEELDGMFNDANLPADQAWAAMTRDLRQTKESRNALTKENSSLKRKLVEMEMQNEEWGALLRAHGLIPS
ncbi:hypothetical protein EIP91_012305 [Steccherinum ochraceum]|uniref:DH domain-containing protein n=1 Tax=Steccherinum ochraceum TaxID=92696 RepID=A0A4R0RGG7_9APHY|nr:hypothetical protein EIP91_012305 [Steccherinum ochraceum]